MAILPEDDFLESDSSHTISADYPVKTTFIFIALYKIMTVAVFASSGLFSRTASTSKEVMSVPDCASLENTPYRRNEVFTWPKAGWKSTSIQFMGWTSDAQSLWLLLTTPDSGAVAARVTDGLLEEFDYYDEVIEHPFRTPYDERRKNFNVERGRFVHLSMLSDEAATTNSIYIAVSDLIEQKTARIDADCLALVWKNKDEFYCRGSKNKDIESIAKYLCIQE